MNTTTASRTQPLIVRTQDVAGFSQGLGEMRILIDGAKSQNEWWLGHNEEFGAGTPARFERLFRGIDQLTKRVPARTPEFGEEVAKLFRQSQYATTIVAPPRWK